MMDINTLLTLDLAEYTTALEALADQMMLEEPRDIDYMRAASSTPAASSQSGTSPSATV